MRTIKAILLTLVSMHAWGQRVQLQVADSMVDINAQQTQSELKPGWTIVDVKLKDKLTHYLSGSHAAQMTDNRTPVFMIEPAGNEVLADYAIIRLQRKRNYRKLPKTELRENKYTRVEPAAFDIMSDGGDGFLCRPLGALKEGEYILVCLSQTPTGSLKDLKVYPFQVPGY